MPSNFICVNINYSAPIIKNIIVNTTDNKKGSIDLEWDKPDYISPSSSAPYSYKIFYKERSSKGDFEELATLDGIGQNKFTVKDLNTQDKSYLFKINFYNKIDGKYNIISVGDPQSSSFLNIGVRDRELMLDLAQSITWNIDSMRVFKKNNKTNKFEYIGRSDNANFLDKGLTNNKLYCYKAKLFGNYDGLSIKTLNQSQEKCQTPKDIGVECPPSIVSNYNCSNNSFSLSWKALTCTDDIVRYRIFYSKTRNSEIEILDSLDKDDNNGGVFNYKTNKIEGCFRVSAVDDNGNESINSNVVCIEPCPEINFYNVFTPNNDGVNDKYIPKGILGAKEYEIHIYNRWGKLVFHSKEINLNWDGKDIHTGKDCSQGVYFYTAVVTKYGNTQEGVNNYATFNYKGYIHLFR